MSLQYRAHRSRAPWKRALALAACASCLALAQAVFAVASAAQRFPVGLLVSAGANASGNVVPDRAKPGTAFFIAFDARALNGPAVLVDVGSRRLSLTGKPSPAGEQGAASWTGVVSGEGGVSSAVFSLRKGRFAGQLVVGSQQYEFATDARGRAVVFEVDAQKVRLYPDGGTDVEVLSWIPDAPDDETAAALPARRDGVVSQIDLMVVYTGAACASRGRDSDGGCSAIEAAVVSAVELGNVALDNSAVAARLRIVHMGEVGYTESGDMTRSLTDLRFGQSVSTAAIHALRDEHRADLVSLLTVDTNLCGYAVRPVRLGPGSDIFGFSVVAENCIFQALMHEIGHNFGAAHDRANTSSSALAGSVVTPNAFGYRDCGDDPYLTIMSYGNGCGRPTTLAHFSNPAVRTSDGRLTGTARENNAEALNFVAPWIEAYRDAETANTPPVANPDVASTRAGVAVSVDVLGNDFDAQGPVSLDAIDLPGGWVWRREAGRALITPPESFSGRLVVAYQISDSEGLTASSTIQITVEPTEPPVQPNRAPVARPDAFTVTAGAEVRLDVIANDSDPDGDALRLDPVSVADGWIARVVGTRLAVTAPLTYRGAYQLRYTVRDDGNATASSLVTLTVLAPPAVPPEVPPATPPEVPPTTTPPVSPVSAAARATGLRYRFNGVRTVVLNWNDTATNETRYQIIRDRQVIAEIGANAQRYIDRLRPVGARHEYRVRAMSPGGGRSSAPVRLTVGEPTLTARVLPRNATQSLVVLQWTGATGATVSIKRGQGVVARVQNDGNHALVFNKGRRVAYRVCNAAQTLCSRALVVTH